MSAVTKLLPGGARVTTFSAFISILAFYHALIAEPEYLFPIASLSAASMVVYSCMTCVMLITSIQARHENVALAVRGGGERSSVMQKAGVQLGLTFSQCVLWLGYIGAFVADLYSEYARISMICPSARCGNYFFALAFGYVQFFLVFTQIISFALVVMEIRSAPGRLSGYSSLGPLLSRQMEELVRLREEGRRARVENHRTRSISLDLSRDEGGANELSLTRHHHEIGIGRNQNDLITFTLTPDSPESIRTRRRTRTISVESTLGRNANGNGKIRKDEVISCVRTRSYPTPTHAPNQGDIGMKLSKVRGNGNGNGRYPPIGTFDGIQINETPKSQKILAALQFEYQDGDGLTFSLPFDMEPPFLQQHSQGQSNGYYRQPSSTNTSQATGTGTPRTLCPLITETPKRKPVPLPGIGMDVPGLLHSPTSPLDTPLQDLAEQYEPHSHTRGQRSRPTVSFSDSVTIPSSAPRSSREGGIVPSPKKKRVPMLFDARNVEYLDITSSTGGR